MITSVKVRNYALLDSIDIRFAEKCNIVSGETGAGKSIIIDALSLAFGDNIDTTFIRDEDKVVYIEVEMKIREQNVRKILRDNGIEEQDSGFIIKRIYEPRTKKNKYSINDISVTKELLKEITLYLIDMIGQHEHQNLLNVKNHIQFLDKFAKIENPVEEYRALFFTYRKKTQRLAQLKDQNQEMKRRKDYLNYAIDEIDKANLSVADEELYIKRKELENAEKIAQVLNMVHEMISGEDSLISKISGLKKQVHNISGISKDFGNLYQMLEETEIKMDESSQFALDYVDSMDYSEEYIRNLDEKLDLIERLKSKYGSGIAEIISFKESAQKEVEQFENIDNEITGLQKDLAVLQKEMEKSGKIISQKRRVWAKNLEEAIEDHLKNIGMEKTKFLVYLTYQEDEKGLAEIDGKRYKLHELGLDYVEFGISTNVGEAIKPLRKIASGGEISRIMLALKIALSSVDPVETFIFDEIDTGIGGSTANLVGKQIKKLSETKQILCITHLPQIAKYADFHLFVEKKEEQNKTKVFIRNLEGEEKVKELARMLSGDTESKVAIDHAKSLIDE